MRPTASLLRGIQLQRLEIFCWSPLLCRNSVVLCRAERVTLSHKYLFVLTDRLCSLRETTSFFLDLESLNQIYQRSNYAQLDTVTYWIIMCFGPFYYFPVVRF